jgi:ZIP family zinc transporter
MTGFELVLLRAGIAVAAAVLGGVIGILWRSPSHRVLCALVSFAAGALLAVTLVEILPESMRQPTGPVRGLFAAAIGLLVFYLVGKYVYYVCPACAASATEEKTGYISLGILMMIALALHSTVDGLAIAAGERTHHELAAYLILLAVSYHKIPEGLALVSVCRLAGYSRLKSLLLTVLVELTTGLGAFLGFFLLKSTAADSPWLGIHLGLVAGSFLYIVGFAIIREMMEHERRSIITYVILGFFTIVAAAFIMRLFGIGEVH